MSGLSVGRSSLRFELCAEPFGFNRAECCRHRFCVSVVKILGAFAYLMQLRLLFDDIWHAIRSSSGQIHLATALPSHSLFSTCSMRDESSHQLEVSVDPAVLSDRLAEAEAELETLRRELEHASRLATLGTIAAGIAHEINNVLTPVLAYAQLASQHAGDQPLQRKALHKARLGAEAATQIVQAILGYAATSDDEPAVARLHDVMQQTMELVTRDLAKDHIKLTLRVPDGAQVCMKPLALQQVLLNLILNARAALANQRFGEVVISAMERSDGMTVIRVSDNGPGIPEDVVGRLFQPFVNAGSPRASSRKKKGGAGLGLSICRRLIENVRGTITASSTPNAGTTFTITLPTAQNQRAIAG